jgi:hypothetical protein
MIELQGVRYTRAGRVHEQEPQAPTDITSLHPPVLKYRPDISINIANTLVMI